MQVWARVIVASILSGLLFVLSLPPAAWGGLGWVCLTPLFWAVRSSGFLHGFVGGIVAAMFGAWLSTTPLIGPPVVVESSVGWNYAGFALFGLVIATLAGAVAEVRRWDSRAVVGLASLGVLLEVATLLRLPAHLALTQFANPPVVFLASLGGIWLVSWLVWCANLVALARPTRTTWLTLVAIVVVTQSITTLEMRRLRQLPMFESGSGAFVAVQGAGDVDRLLQIQSTGIGERQLLSVWPELAVAEYDLGEMTKFAASRQGVPMVTTFNDQGPRGQRNVAAVISASGASARYAKRKPFASEASQIVAGTEPLSVRVADVRVGLNICFDSCYPWVMRDTVRLGADVIALPTLDPASPNGFVQAIHGAFTPFRAAELGVPIVRAETTAWSMIVNSRGRILGLSPVGVDGPLVRRVKTGPVGTVPMLLGDWWLAVCSGLFLYWVWPRRQST
jgi:apolipoprotein N-acyltransferase